MPVSAGRRGSARTRAAAALAAASVAFALGLPESAPAAASRDMPRHAAVGAQPPDGKQLYATTCSACHQLSGVGIADTYPPLAESEWVGGDVERLVRVVLHGLTGDIEVAGEPFSGAMPAWGASLDDAQVAAVLSYIRSEWGNAAGPVTPATVARVRRATAGRTTPWTAKELSGRAPPPG